MGPRFSYVLINNFYWLRSYPSWTPTAINWLSHFINVQGLISQVFFLTIPQHLFEAAHVCVGQGRRLDVSSARTGINVTTTTSGTLMKPQANHFTHKVHFYSSSTALGGALPWGVCNLQAGTYREMPYESVILSLPHHAPQWLYLFTTYFRWCNHICADSAMHVIRVKWGQRWTGNGFTLGVCLPGCRLPWAPGTV